MSLILSGTDGLSDVDGTAATPAIRGTDANTGIFFPAADTIAFAEGGAECARFDSSGNFGIGTATPYRQFQVGNYSTNAIMALGSSPTSTGTLVFASADSAPGRYVGSIDYNHTSNYLSFTANASERARFNSTGAFVLAGGTTTANGVGITFPATQSASSDANTLDDYEEGTWTPSVKFGGASVGITGTFSGKYTKIGNLVTISCRLTFTSKGSSTGRMTIDTLPFNVGANNPGSSGFTYIQRLAALQTSGQLYFQIDDTTIYPNFAGYGSGNTTGLTNTSIDDSTDIQGSFSVFI